MGLFNLIPLPYRILIAVGGMTALLGGVYFKGYHDGVEKERIVNIKSEHKALIKEVKVIVGAFNEADRIVAKLNETPDLSPAPDLIVSAIDQLPTPRTKPPRTDHLMRSPTKAK